MKQKILAVILMVIVIVFVSINTIVLERQICATMEKVETLSLEDGDAERNAKEIYSDYKRKEKYMSVTVSHDDLTSIEDCFVEMIGFISVDDVQNATVTKSRLISCLEHLRRLSGFNIDAII